MYSNTIPPVGRSFESVGDRALFRRDLSQFLRKNEVVFFEWASELLVAATQLPKTCGIITRLHRYEMYRWVDKVNWDNVDKIILVSKAKQDEFIEKFPVHADKTVVINVAVPLEKFSYQPHPYSGEIGTLCHLAPRKRVYDLILNFYELLRQFEPRPNGRSTFHLHIGGDVHQLHGDYFRAMHDLVASLGLGDNVTFYGKVTDTWNWYHKLDIFISNSYSEGPAGGTDGSDGFRMLLSLTPLDRSKRNAASRKSILHRLRVTIQNIGIRRFERDRTRRKKIFHA